MNLLPCALLLLGPALLADAAEERALAFLAQEAQRWTAENKCFSCHNNGDAARALYAAVRRGRPLPARALDETTRWLSRPADWDRNPGEEAPRDLGLARVQFATALLEAMDAGRVQERAPLTRAAELVVEHQKKDGSWRPAGEEVVGSPVSYGPFLLTGQARRVLLRADPVRYREAIARADRWLRQAEVKSVLDAAALLLALEDSSDAEAEKQRRHCLELISKAQAKDGGWGPFAGSPTEPFDTAVVLLALAGRKKDKEVAARIERGRAYLIAAQRKDGSWQETTRPAGAASYAQRISTAGWAALALLATRP
jgi:hypothetical protein